MELTEIACGKGGWRRQLEKGTGTFLGGEFCLWLIATMAALNLLVHRSNDSEYQGGGREEQQRERVTTVMTCSRVCLGTSC